MSAQDRAGRGRPETVPEPSGGEGVRHVVFACRSTALAGGITTVVDELAMDRVTAHAAAGTTLRKRKRVHDACAERTVNPTEVFLSPHNPPCSGRSRRT